MGNAELTQRVFKLINVSKSNTTKEEDKEVAKVLKRYLTKKEYKSFFTLDGVSPEECLVLMQCTIDEWNGYIKKVQHKLKSDALRNEIIAIIGA